MTRERSNWEQINLLVPRTLLRRVRARARERLLSLSAHVRWVLASDLEESDILNDGAGNVKHFAAEPFCAVCGASLAPGGRVLSLNPTQHKRPIAGSSEG